jgi:hypothetical protein
MENRLYAAVDPAYGSGGRIRGKQMKVSDLTGVGRPLDMKYPTNRAVAICSLVFAAAAAAVLGVRGDRFLDVILGGLNAGLAIFLAWALCRELDPDNPLSAFVSAGLAAAGFFLAEVRPEVRPEVRVLILFWFVLVLRTVNRTTGTPVKWWDSLFILGFSGYLMWSRGNWVYGASVSAVFFLDGSLSEPNKRQFFFGSASLGLTGLWLMSGGTMWRMAELGAFLLLPLLLPGCFFVPLFLWSGEIRSTGDASGKPLHPGRVRASQAAALFALTQIGLWRGIEGMAELLPMWAGAVGAVLYGAFVRIIVRKSSP